MAAAREPLSEVPEILDLRRVSGRQLEPLLLEETIEWERELDWDFGRSAELVRQYADSRSLQGMVMLSRDEIVGYGYCVLEEHKGLVGDIYIRPPWRTPESEAYLMKLMLQGLAGISHVRRVESQLMLLDVHSAPAVARERGVRIYERVLMMLDTEHFPGGSAIPAAFRAEPWADYQHQTSAAIIAAAYRGHVDSEINDQYRSPSGAERFLYNIVQYPGCGNFYRATSHLAFDRATGAPAGVVLCSIVGPSTGHITQLCITPGTQGQGLGRALLDRAVSGLRAAGVKRVSLTVTVSNTAAVRLYEQSGFREMRRFYACIWER